MVNRLLIAGMLALCLLPACAKASDELYREDFDSVDAWGGRPAGGQTVAKKGIGTFTDTRKGRELADVSPPLWAAACKGDAPAGSWIEVRVKAPTDVKYWIDLVNARNESIATIPLGAGTGQWQTRRAVFQGQFGSAGSDLFVRVAKDSDQGNDSVEIDFIAIHPPDPKAATDMNQQRNAIKPENNLALAKHECFVLSSSFADVGDSYTDNLIDGKPGTIWRSWPAAPMPQWAELRWEYPIRINQVWLTPAGSNAPQKFTIQRWEKEAWVPVKSFDAPAVWPAGGFLAEIEPITTDRLRVTIEAADGDSVQLAEIEVYGPDQPLVFQLRPYWQGHYIWYPEPDKVVRGEPRYFRKTFTIDDPAKIDSAFLQARSNDGYIAYLNGKEMARGSILIQPIDLKPHLIAGENCIAFTADVRKDPGWPLMTLLADITINDATGPRSIGSDTTWKSSPDAPEGWRLAGYDDSAWTNAFICATPPDEPWGRIPYFDVMAKEQLVVRGATVTPASARPGDTVVIELQLESPAALKQDYLILLKAGEPEINSDRQNFVVAQCAVVPETPTSKWAAGTSMPVRAEVRIPSYAPAGRTPIFISALGLNERASLAFSGDGIGKDGAIAFLEVDRGNQAAEAISEPGGRLLKENGVCKIVAGGKTVAPFLWALQSPSIERFDKYSAQGIHLYHLQIYPYRIESNGDYQNVHFLFVDQHIRQLLRIDPNAQIMVEMDLRDSRAWAQANPNERMMTAQGKPVSASFASPEYQEEVVSFVRQLVKFLNTKDYRDRIIGYIPEIAEPESSLGGAEQNGFQADRSLLNIGDYNPLAIERFRAFLRTKYADSVEALRTSWRDTSVTFETAQPKLEELTREGEQGGVFRDPTKGRLAFDYFEFLSTFVPTFVIENVGKVIKEETGGKALVGFYYGYTVETMRSANNPGALMQGNHFYFNQAIDSPYIDFFMSPLQYDNRMAGDKFMPFQPLASIRLHNKLYIAEEDIRTYIASLKSYGRQRSSEESVAVLQNHLGTAIIGGTGAWMADWSAGSGHARSAMPFFTQPELLKTIRQMKEIYDKTLDVERTSSTQIAVFVADKSQYYHDVAYASVLYKNLITEMLYEQLPNIGAPFDIYMMEDIKHEFVQDQYKLYILLNSFYMDDSERAAVEKLKREGKTLLTFYAPGYVSNERGLSTADISKTTGMDVEVSFEKQKLACSTTAIRHPVLQGISEGTSYVAEGFDYAPETARLHPTAIGPRFTIVDEKAARLAAYADGGTALAARDFGDWKSVYAAVPYLDTAALRNIAEWAGVHLYTEPGIVVEACDQFVLLHNGFSRDRTLDVRLPQTGDVHDLLTDKPVASNTRQFRVNLPRCTTMFYQVK